MPLASILSNLLWCSGLCWVMLLPAQAQLATQEALDKACSCLNDKDFSLGAAERAHFLFDSCMQEALYTNMTGVLEEQNASLEDAASMARLGSYFQTYLDSNCVGYRNFSTRQALEVVEEIRQSHPSSKGLLYQIDFEAPFPIISILNDTAECLDFLWLREFDGSTRFMEGIKDYDYTLVEIFWREVELYNAEQKKYQLYKEIVLIETRGTLNHQERQARKRRYKQHNSTKKQRRGSKRTKR